MNNTIGIQKGGCLMKEVEVIKARSSSSNSVRGK